MSTPLTSYLLLFCRLVIGIVFTFSFLGKIGNLPTLERTIDQFNLIPKRLSRPLAWLLLTGELTVVVLMLLEGIWLMLGLALAAGMLVTFSLALASVLVRKIQTSCHCFGPSTKPVSAFDIWRNACFIACALGGCGSLASLKNLSTRPELWELCLTALAAAFFVGVATQLGEIAQLLRQG